MTEEEARKLFIAELVRSSEEGPAPDCAAEQMAAILAEHEAACAEMRRAEVEQKGRRRR